MPAIPSGSNRRPRDYAVGCGTLAAVAIVLILVFGFFAGWKSVGRAELMLVYGGGPFDPGVNEYQTTNGPGGRHATGLAEKIYKYPIAARTWQIDAGNPNADYQTAIPCQTKAQPGGAKDITGARGATINIESASTFRINAHDLRAIHEQYGFNKHLYDGWDDPGNTDTAWYRGLVELYHRPLANAIAAACINRTYDDFQTATGRAQFNRDVIAEFGREQTGLLGLSMWCGPLPASVAAEQIAAQPCGPIAFSVSPPGVSPEIAKAGEQVEIAKRQAAAVAAAASSAKAAISASGLTPEQWLQLQAINKATTVIIGPSGTSVAVPPPAK
jgi:hypothetical protein